MSLAPGSEKEVDKGVAKFFGAWLPSRDMNAVYYYLDEDGLGMPPVKSGIPALHLPASWITKPSRWRSISIATPKLKTRSNMKRCISMASNCWDSAEPARIV